jgi:hypothetical protein
MEYPRSKAITGFERIEVNIKSHRGDIAKAIMNMIAVAVHIHVCFVVSAYFCINWVVSSSSFVSLSTGG